jgi:16S rRNA processing protein RimM
MMKDRILVGRFGAAHGIKGEVRLKSLTSDPQAIKNYEPLLDKEGTRRFKILSLRPLKNDLVVARVVGIDDRSAAEALANVELFIPHESLPPPDPDEFYCADLIGLIARDPSGAAIGQVRDVLDYGGGDILEIAPQDGGETLLVPFAKKFVPTVDMEAGAVTILPPVEIEAEACLESRPRPSAGAQPARPRAGRNTGKA